MKRWFFLLLVVCTSVKLFGQVYSASFVAKLGNDTVIVETYNMLPNHLFGKAFLRYPEDQIGVFNFHFYPDGSIKHYSISLMRPDSNFLITWGTQGLYVENDTCTWFASMPDRKNEYINKRPVLRMDFVGGWTPTLSLIEWNCMRLIKSGKQTLPLTMINDYIGIKNIAVTKANGDTLLFGGDFLEYTKIKVNADGQIIAYDGTSTPWSYIATKHDPIDVDAVAKRLSKTAKIGYPSPEEHVNAFIENDTISLSYGRPSRRGRKIFGGVVPYDSVWRTGAGLHTKIKLPYDVLFGKTLVPRGEYSIYSIPRRDNWTLILNSDFKRWPTEPDRSKDIAIIPMTVQKTPAHTDQFTITIEPVKGGGVIRFAWDETEAVAPFKVVKK